MNNVKITHLIMSSEASSNQTTEMKSNTVTNNSNNYDPPLNSPYTQMDCKFEADIIRQVIGREGCYFKQITQKTGVYYIWHKRKEGHIEIWGPEENLQKAIHQIHNRLYFVISNMLRGRKKVSIYSWSWYQWYTNMRFTPPVLISEQNNTSLQEDNENSFSHHSNDGLNINATTFISSSEQESITDE